MASQQAPYQRLTIYVGESDRREGRPLWQNILQLLRAREMAGATVIRGIAGFGAHSRLHTASLVRLSQDLPIRIEVVDRADRIDAIMPELIALVQEGLITVEPVQVVQYTHRYVRSLPEHLKVADIMSHDVVTATPETPVEQVAEWLVRRLFRAVPVVDEKGHVVGIVSDGDLVRRTGLWPGRDVPLDEGQVRRWLDRLAESQLKAADIMTAPVRTARADASALEAASIMAHTGLKRLPVVDAHGHLVGMISRIDILKAMTGEAEAPSPPSPVRPAHTVRDVMRADVPRVSPDTPLDEVVDRLMESGLRRVVVVDEAQRPVGLITDGMLLRWAEAQQERGLWESILNRLRPNREMRRRLATAGRAADLMRPPPPPVAANAPLSEALAQAIQTQEKRLIVVDEAGRVVGMIDRQQMLRALLGIPSNSA